MTWDESAAGDMVADWSERALVGAVCCFPSSKVQEEKKKVFDFADFPSRAFQNAEAVIQAES